MRAKLILSALLPLVLCAQYPSGGGGTGGGTGVPAGTPYTTTGTGTTVSITAAVHGKGTKPIWGPGSCIVTATGVAPTAIAYTRAAATGDVSATWTGSVAYTCDVWASGQPGVAGSPGEVTSDPGTYVDGQLMASQGTSGNILRPLTLTGIMYSVAGVPQPVMGGANDCVKVNGLAGACGTTGEGGAAWGSITGTLSEQTDLNTALNGKQAVNANLTAMSALVPNTARCDYFSSATVMGLYVCTAFWRGLGASPDASAARSGLGLGDSATRNVGTSGTDVATGERGVTNGDTHDHVGGDGAGIPFAAITGEATDVQIPDNITVAMAALAGALTADPADCVNQFSRGINAAGTAQCSLVLTADIAESAVGASKIAQPTRFDSQQYCADAGSTDAYACALTVVPTAYVTGGTYSMKVATPNTGAATVDFNALGAKTIKKDVTSDLSDNDLKAGEIVNLMYDGVNMQCMSCAGSGPGGSGTVSSGTVNGTAVYTAATTVGSVAPGTAGYVLTSNGPSSPPSFQVASGAPGAGVAQFTLTTTVGTDTIALTNTALVEIQSGDDVNPYSPASNRTLIPSAGTCWAYWYEWDGTLYVGIDQAGGCQGAAVNVTKTDVTTYPVGVNRIGRVQISGGNIVDDSEDSEQTVFRMPKRNVAGPNMLITEDANTVNFESRLSAAAETSLVCDGVTSSAVTINATPTPFSNDCTIPANRVAAGTVIEVTATYDVHTVTCTTAPGIQLVVNWEGVPVWASAGPSQAGQQVALDQTHRGGFGRWMFTGTAAPGASVNVETGGKIELKGVTETLNSLAGNSPQAVPTNATALLRIVVVGTATAVPAGCATITQRQFHATIVN